MSAPLLLAAWAVLQESPVWIARPERPTVGDTVWLEARVAAPAGWVVRPGRLATGGSVEPLGDPVARREASGWIVRFPVVAWRAGPHNVPLPALWRLGPDGAADSTPGGAASFRVASVLPDTGRPQPRPARPPLRRATRRAGFPLAAAGLSAGLLATAVWWRRRRPRPDRGPAPPPRDRVTADDVWLAAGESRAVAARAAAELRAAIARTVPDAHVGLTTEECLAVLLDRRPAGAAEELGDVLRALDRVAFASVHGVDVGALAGRARSLAAGVRG